jgi:hypothetical protein
VEYGRQIGKAAQKEDSSFPIWESMGEISVPVMKFVRFKASRRKNEPVQGRKISILSAPINIENQRGTKVPAGPKGQGFMRFIGTTGSRALTPADAKARTALMPGIVSV